MGKLLITVCNVTLKSTLTESTNESPQCGALQLTCFQYEAGKFDSISGNKVLKVMSRQNLLTKHFRSLRLCNIFAQKTLRVWIAGVTPSSPSWGTVALTSTQKAEENVILDVKGYIKYMEDFQIA